jgi:hypothetical protein
VWYLIAGLFAAIWTGLDAYSRRSNVALYAVGAFLFAPMVVPIWIASRPLRTGETREGGRAWNVLRNFAITWTILMAIAAFVGLLAAGKSVSHADSEAAQTGAGLGILLGMGLLGMVWFVPMIGTVVLGFILKKANANEVGPTGPLATPNLPPRGFEWTTVATAGFALLATFAAVGLNKGLADGESMHPDSAAAATVARSAPQAAPASTAQDPLSPSPNPTATTVTVSFATFTPKDTLLNECIDFMISPPQGTEVDSVFLDAFADGINKGKVRNAPASTARSLAIADFIDGANKGRPLDGTRIYKTCADQFRGKPVLATCAVNFTTSVTGDYDADLGTFELALTRSFYSLDSLTNNDANMRQCIAAKGDWQAVDKDSDEYREAVRARARREVERLQRTLGGGQ